jgi:hypothetical protein
MKTEAEIKEALKLLAHAILAAQDYHDGAVSTAAYIQAVALVWVLDAEEQLEKIGAPPESAFSALLDSLRFAAHQQQQETRKE